MVSASLRKVSQKLNRLSTAKDEDEQVSLGQFAAVCGMTEREYVGAMYRAIERGSVLDLVKDDARDDFYCWLALLGQENFGLMFRLSLNRTRDAALFCKCRKNGENIEVLDTVPGLTGLVPPEVAQLDGFEFTFCDLRTDPPRD